MARHLNCGLITNLLNSSTLLVPNLRHSVKYLPGQVNIADSLSRLTKSDEAQSRNVAEEYVRFVARTAVPQAMTGKEVEEESAADEELENLRQCIKTGNWENPSCASYKPIREELCVFGKTVLRGTRIVIPRKLRGRVIELGHENETKITNESLVARHR